MFAITLDNVIFHGEIMFGINRTIFRNQVAYVPVRGQYLKVASKIFLERFALEGDSTINSLDMHA